MSQVFPEAEWLHGAPEAHGLDDAKLRAAAADAFKVEKRYGFLVVKDGVIVHKTRKP